MFENKTMYQLVEEAVEKVPNGTAVYYSGKKISFKQLNNLIIKTSEVLERKLSVKKGDVITIALPNIPDTLILLYACNRLGAICNMVHPFTPFNQMKVILDKTKSKWAFLFEQRVAKELDKYLTIQDYVYVCRVENYLPTFKKFFYHYFMNFSIRHKLRKKMSYPRHYSFKYFHSLKGSLNKKTTYIKDQGSSPALLLHSGSTTGDPKTIVLSNDNINFIASKASYILGLSSEEMIGKGIISFLPSFHGFGLAMTMHLPLANCFSTSLIPKFSSKAVVDAMNKSNINFFVGVPTAYESLLKSEEFTRNKNIKNIEVTYSGGESISKTLVSSWNELMKKHNSPSQIYEGYGLTESVAAIIVNSPQHHKPSSLGYPLEGVEVKIMLENGKEAKPNTIGQIAVKAPSNMICYFKDPTATDEAKKEGYIYTGDLGYIDEDGFVFFSSRLKRVVKVSGVGVFPSEVEALVATVPGVEKVAAIRIPDSRLQSALKLVVVSKYVDKEGLRQEILKTCQHYLIRWSVPKEIEFKDELPLTVYNKINYRVLQEEEDKARGLN